MTATSAPATFARTLEVARAALAGVEMLTLSVRYGLAVPADRLVMMTEAVETARRELNALELELEQWALVDQARGVH
jgi:hypothetical protein